MVPAGHGEHDDALEAYVPAEQVTHPQAPPDETSPELQLTHVIPSEENVPAGQLVHELTPPLEYVPVKHEMHADAATSP